MYIWSVVCLVVICYISMRCAGWSGDWVMTISVRCETTMLCCVTSNNITCTVITVSPCWFAGWVLAIIVMI